jgi:hypothetical protein
MNRDAIRAELLEIEGLLAIKPLDSSLTIPAEIHDAVMTLLPEERLDREKVNEAVRDGLAGPLRPAGSADLYGVPKATE